jgi:hypothetical protein
MAHDNVQTLHSSAIVNMMHTYLSFAFDGFYFIHFLFHSLKKTNRQYGKTKGSSEKREGARKNEGALIFTNLSVLYCNCQVLINYPL